MVSLFTKVPIPETIDIIKSKLNSDPLGDTIARLSEHYLKYTYFLWNDNFYEQKSGCAVGSPLSPVVANLFTENFEQVAINSFQFKPKY